MALHSIKSSQNDDLFDKSVATKPLSKNKMPEKESDPKVMYQLIKDELLLDGNSRQNLATFCQTFTDDEIQWYLFIFAFFQTQQRDVTITIPQTASEKKHRLTRPYTFNIDI